METRTGVVGPMSTALPSTTASSPPRDCARSRYYESGVSSAYFWELEGAVDFAACVLFRKDAADLGKGSGKGRWDALHVFEAKVGREKTVYKLTSTIMLSITTAEAGEMKIAGSLTRQSEKAEIALKNRDHVLNMGRQLEEMELKMRDALIHIYFGKVCEVFGNMRKFQGNKVEQERKLMQAGLTAALAKRRAAQPEE
mmetsp:Transcript_42588/g.99918  ORF Transcript_42588/g.99918 Transcript_42588/m.99918 type:complete len:198 (-) Transcript_42588:169-762(-)